MGPWKSTRWVDSGNVGATDHSYPPRVALHSSQFVTSQGVCADLRPFLSSADPRIGERISENPETVRERVETVADDAGEAEKLSLQERALNACRTDATAAQSERERLLGTCTRVSKWIKVLSTGGRSCGEALDPLA